MGGGGCSFSSKHDGMACREGFDLGVSIFQCALQYLSNRPTLCDQSLITLRVFFRQLSTIAPTKVHFLISMTYFPLFVHGVLHTFQRLFHHCLCNCIAVITDIDSLAEASSFFSLLPQLVAVLSRPCGALTILMSLLARFLLGLLAVFAALSTSAAALSVLVDPACFYKRYLAQGFVHRYVHFNTLSSRIFWTPPFHCPPLHRHLQLCRSPPGRPHHVFLLLLFFVLYGVRPGHGVSRPKRRRHILGRPKSLVSPDLHSGARLATCSRLPLFSPDPQ